jgi:hypothetical protein
MVKPIKERWCPRRIRHQLYIPTCQPWVNALLCDFAAVTWDEMELDGEVCAIRQLVQLQQNVALETFCPSPSNTQNSHITPDSLNEKIVFPHQLRKHRTSIHYDD